MSHSSWGRKRSVTTEWLTLTNTNICATFIPLVLLFKYRNIGPQVQSNQEATTFNNTVLFSLYLFWRLLSVFRKWCCLSIYSYHIKLLYIYLFIDCAGSSLLCGLFSSGGEQGLLSSCRVGFALRWLLLLWSAGTRAQGWLSCTAQ